MNTSTTFYETTLTPMCSLPFSMVDFMYNPRCYSETILEALEWAFRMYISFNLVFFDLIIEFVEIAWFPVLYGIVLGSVVYGLWRVFQLNDSEEPLTHLEAEITQYIHANASTGCTVRMIYEYLDRVYEKEVRMNEIHRALQTLRVRGVLLPVSTTLWVVSGN